MKELGHSECYLSTDKVNWVKHRGNFYYKTRYVEPFEDEYEECTYEQLDNSTWNFWTHEPWLFNKKEYKEIRYFNGDESFKVYPGEKVYQKKVWCKDTHSESFDYLSKHMNADEFIEYLKDKGLNTCPIIK